MKVLWVYRRGREKRLASWQENHDGIEFFYGLLALRDHYQSSFIEDSPSNRISPFWYPVELAMAKLLKMGFALHIALWNWAKLRQADILVATNDAVGLPLAFLKS